VQEFYSSMGQADKAGGARKAVERYGVEIWDALAGKYTEEGVKAFRAALVSSPLSPKWAASRPAPAAAASPAAVGTGTTFIAPKLGEANLAFGTLGATVQAEGAFGPPPPVSGSGSGMPRSLFSSSAAEGASSWAQQGMLTVPEKAPVVAIAAAPAPTAPAPAVSSFGGGFGASSTGAFGGFGASGACLGSAFGGAAAVIPSFGSGPVSLPSFGAMGADMKAAPAPSAAAPSPAPAATGKAVTVSVSSGKLGLKLEAAKPGSASMTTVASVGADSPAGAAGVGPCWLLVSCNGQDVRTLGFNAVQMSVAKAGSAMSASSPLVLVFEPPAGAAAAPAPAAPALAPAAVSLAAIQATKAAVAQPLEEETEDEGEEEEEEDAAIRPILRLRRSRPRPRLTRRRGRGRHGGGSDNATKMM
jgi:hypothetical protein